MSNYRDFINSRRPGKVLCDMDDGLSQLETAIPGFVLLSHHRIKCDNSTEAVTAILNGVLGQQGYTYFNKLLVLVGDSPYHNAFYAVYSFDNRYFGSICFKIEG